MVVLANGPWQPEQSVPYRATPSIVGVGVGVGAGAARASAIAWTWADVRVLNEPIAPTVPIAVWI